MHILPLPLQKVSSYLTVLPLTVTISPGFTSLTNSPPTVGKAQLGRRRRGLRRRIRRGRGFLFGLGRRLRPGRPAAACRQQAAEQGQKQNDSSFHTHHR